jgi:hypothetical protein
MRLYLAAVLVAALAVPAVTLPSWAQQQPAKRNVVLFIADGLRPGVVND